MTWQPLTRAECALTNALHAARDARLVSDWSFEAGGNWVVLYSDGTVSGRPLLGTAALLAQRIALCWAAFVQDDPWPRLLDRMECLAEECRWWEVA